MTKEMNLETSELGILWALTRELQNIVIITVWYCTAYEEIRRKELMQYKVNKEIWNFGKYQGIKNNLRIKKIVVIFFGVNTKIYK